MSVDLMGIIAHRLSKQDLLDLPAMLDQWSPIDATKNPAKWRCDYEMTPDTLEAIWQDWETNAAPPSINEVFDNVIDCSFGSIDVWRNTIVVCSDRHRYDFLCDPVSAAKILHANRIIARHLNAAVILYTTDSSYPTSVIIDKAQLGMTVNELIAFGIEQFGTPPKQVAEGVKYMFFIDEITTEIGELKEWNINTDGYWRYNFGKNKYELKQNVNGSD